MARENYENRRNSRIGILVIVLIVALLISLVFVLPQFYISNVSVEGNRKLDAQSILIQADIDEEKHLFSYISGDLTDYLTFRYGDIEDSLESAFPYIDEVKVQVSFPYEVKITVEEMVEIAYVHSKNAYVAISRNGEILEVLRERPETNAAIIEGINLRSHNLGETISEEIQRQISRALSLQVIMLESDNLADDDWQISESVSEFRPYQANALYFVINLENGEELNIKIDPSENTQEAISWLRNALEQGVLDDLGEGILTVSESQKVFNAGERLPLAINESASIETEQVEDESEVSSAAGDDTATSSTIEETTEVTSDETTSADETEVTTIIAPGG